MQLGRHEQQLVMQHKQEVLSEQQQLEQKQLILQLVLGRQQQLGQQQLI